MVASVDRVLSEPQVSPGTATACNLLIGSTIGSQFQFVSPGTATASNLAILSSAGGAGGRSSGLLVGTVVGVPAIRGDAADVGILLLVLLLLLLLLRIEADADDLVVTSALAVDTSSTACSATASSRGFLHALTPSKCVSWFSVEGWPIVSLLSPSMTPFISSYLRLLPVLLAAA